MGMRIGIGLPSQVGLDRERHLIDWMRRIDETRFETLAVIDEIVSPNVDALACLAAAAAVTQRVRLMSTVIVGPLRNATLLAKQAASIDALSGGRLSLGLGVGDDGADFAAVGVAPQGRGVYFDEQLAHMRRIWAGEPMSADGRSIGPPPAQLGGPRLLFGGWARPALERIARFGDGYIGALLSADMLSDAHFSLVEQFWQEHGRPGRPSHVQNVYFALGDDATETLRTFVEAEYASHPDYDISGILQVSPCTESDIRTTVERVAAIGADELIFHPASGDIQQIARLEQAVA
jgi:alkanesulfonate monooxygenase SsuD/methylene tetrahydromethanopterin reductase-like flavin-dependent oxidoreductase (luciferase family)